jgi:signal transduction histidine kinase
MTQTRVSGRRVLLYGLAVATVALAGVAASLLLWVPIDLDERLHLRRTTVHSAANVGASVAADLRSRVRTQRRLAELWGAEEKFSDLALAFSGLFLGDQSGNVAVVWIDPLDRVHLVAARDREEDANAEILEMQARSQVKAVAWAGNGVPFISPAFYLADGREVRATAVRVFKRGAPDGFLVTVFDVQVALESALKSFLTAGYSISILEGAREVYRTPGTTREHENEWAEDKDLQFPETAWRIRVWPNPELLADLRSPLPEFALGLGGVLGLLLMTTAQFARTTYRTSQRLRADHDVLEAHVSDRKVELREVTASLQKQIAERGRAEDSVQNLSGRLLRLQDDERRRIARDLHDSTAQLLASVGIAIGQAMRFADRDGNTALRGVLDDSAACLDRVTLEIRTISYLLHPPMLDELGLECVLPWYASGFSKRGGIEIALNVTPGFGRLPKDAEVTIFRVLQEALTNVHRHSGSRTARIALSRDDHAVMLEVADQGHGLDSAVFDGTSEAFEKLGVGIAGMRERLLQLGGRLEITGTRGGTTVRAMLPVTRSAVTT